MMVEKIDERKRRILEAIIHEHIFTAEPVGSRTLARNYHFDLSSATIRNEMSDLEEMGFLEQPHTSAGRIPSDKGYRYYVDTLIGDERQEGDYRLLLREFNQEMQSIQNVISGMAKMLSEMTRYTSMVSEPQLEKTRIKKVELLPIEGDSLLIVLITDTGIVHNKIIQLPQLLNARQIRYLNQYISSQVRDKELSRIDNGFLQELEQRMQRKLDLSQGIFQLIYQGLEKISQPSDFNIYLGGTSYILEQPEFNDLENLKKVLNVLDHQELLRELFKGLPNKGIEVTIGQENEISDIQNCSIVFATYFLGEKAFGKIGVIGPTRMEYSRVISSVNSVAKVLGEIISRAGR